MSLNVYLEGENGSELYDANITHNLGKMADMAGVYQCCWHPEKENGNPTYARELIEPLYNGICAMIKDPKKFEAYNAPNGWGLYENFLPWLQRYLRACQDNPDSIVRVSR